MPLPDPTRRASEECARLASLPVRHAHAAGIDVLNAIISASTLR